MRSIPLCRLPLLVSVCSLALIAEGALAQQQPSPTRDAEAEETDVSNTSGGTDGEIIVRAGRLRGQLDVEQAPILELDEDDIAAEGVTSISELVTQISNQTGSARGRGGGQPVILINGIRPGSFREFFNFPPESLARVEVFPEEVAQRFGFSPDQRVINLILKDNYRNAEVELEFEGPTRGGFFVNEQELGFLQIAGGGRFNVNFTANDRSLLTEAERDIIQTPGSFSDLASDPDPAAFRSLLNDTRSLDGNVSWSKAFLESGVAVSANINYNRFDNFGLSGLNTVVLTDPDGNSLLRTFGEDTPLEVRGSTDTFAGSGSLTKPVNAFRLTSTFNASLSETTTEIDNPFDVSGLVGEAAAGLLSLDGPLPQSADGGFDTAFTRATAASTLTTLRGPLANLPGGELIATFDLGYNWNRIQSSDTRTIDDVELTRGDLSTGANLTIPITSRRNGFADALGSFTFTAQAGLNYLSDFGTLGDFNLGLNWELTDKLDLSASYITREVAPGLAALGNPEVTFFNSPVFDFVNGETVLATVITGGNPDLLAETQRDWKFTANWELPKVRNTRLTLEYVRNRSDDVTRAFPQITSAIEAAFPDRIFRDAEGVLTAVDTRSVTFEETRAERLQISLFTRGSFGAGPPPGGGGQQGGRASGRRGGPPPGASGGSGAGARAGGSPSPERRQQFIAFRERLCADDGVAFLTRLVRAVENGEDLSAEIPGFNPQMLERMLSRVRDANGEISDERLAAFRTRLCSAGPAAFAPPNNGEGDSNPSGRGGGERFAALRQKICGDNGLEELQKLIAAIDRGEDVSELIPGVDPQFLTLMLDRVRDDDGNVRPEALEQFRDRICQSGAQGGGQGGRAGAGSGGPPAGFNPLARRNFSGWRYFVSLNHTIELENEILIAPGVPVLDQLDGDGTGTFGFPRNTTRLEAGLFSGGLGFRLSGRYIGSAQLNGSGLPGSSDLFFDDLATFDLRVFSNLGQLLGKNDGALKNVRVSLLMNNIFDAQRRVVDDNGDTPINFQPLRIDPVGRFVGIDLRKLF